MIRLFSAALLVIMITTSFDTIVSSQQKTVKGKITGTASEGLSDAYVYVIAGEEETLSERDGNFSLKTWQGLPVVLVIEHKDFETQRITIEAAEKPLNIRMMQRKN